MMISFDEGTDMKIDGLNYCIGLNIDCFNTYLKQDRG